MNRHHLALIALTASLIVMIAAFYAVTSTNESPPAADVVVVGLARQTEAPAPSKLALADPDRGKIEIIRDLRSRIRRQRATIVAMMEARNEYDRAPTLAQQDLEWTLAYIAGGGQHLAQFYDTILPCESGGELDPHAAISPSRDYGRGQVNRAVWRTTVEQKWPDMPFEQSMLIPDRNGAMTAYIESEARSNGWNPLDPWVCAKKNGLA